MLAMHDYSHKIPSMNQNLPDPSMFCTSVPLCNVTLRNIKKIKKIIHVYNTHAGGGQYIQGICS